MSNDIIAHPHPHGAAQDISGCGPLSKPSSQRARQPLGSSPSGSSTATARRLTPSTPGMDAPAEAAGIARAHSFSSSCQATAAESQGVAVDVAAGTAGPGSGGTVGSGDGSKREGGGRGLGKSNSLLDLPGAANLLVSPVEVERHNQALQVRTRRPVAALFAQVQSLITTRLPSCWLCCLHCRK